MWRNWYTRMIQVHVSIALVRVQVPPSARKRFWKQKRFLFLIRAYDAIKPYEILKPHDIVLICRLLRSKAGLNRAVLNFQSSCE